MKNVIAASVFALMATSAAVAADPIRPVTPSPITPTIVASSGWDGFYAGANAGYGWGRGTVTVGGVSASDDINGWLGGAQLGYNFSSGGMVFGIEGDVQAAKVVYSTSPAAGVTTELGIGTFGTLRARVGADLDGFLPYITAGLAVGSLYWDVTAGGATVSESRTSFGWAAGAGVEAMVTDSISFKGEYLYVDFGDVNFPTAGLDARAHAHVARVGLNFHF